VPSIKVLAPAGEHEISPKGRWETDRKPQGVVTLPHEHLSNGTAIKREERIGAVRPKDVERVWKPREQKCNVVHGRGGGILQPDGAFLEWGGVNGNERHFRGAMGGLQNYRVKGWRPDQYAWGIRVVFDAETRQGWVPKVQKTAFPGG